ncbi:MAG TPA: hypothetical protein P5077_01460 [bacterium]|nr:hypothetical protein [bacterium]
MKATLLCLLASGSLLISCATANIQGTDIPDTPQNRAVIQVFFEYVEAVKAQNADKLLALVSEHYLDANGTDDATDDVDYEGVKKFVNSDAYRNIRAVSTFFIVKDMSVSPDEQTAKILYYYEVRIKTDRLAPPEEGSSINSDTQKWLKETEVNQMLLKKEGDKWKIVSGL